MIALPFLRRSSLALQGDRVTLRLPQASDYREWAALRAASRAFLEPWEPRWAPDELERSAWRQRLSRYVEDHAGGTALPFFIFENASGALVSGTALPFFILENASGALIGGITLGNIRYGVAQTGQIGYWIGERYAGQGLMLEALGQLVHHAFEQLRLHRIEAACIPDNLRSLRLLEKAGFQREGLLRSYLRINGMWQDHYLYALVVGDHPAGLKRG
jgi:[ribosomal protein S5]-alanine N-acetyltransferase